MRIGARNRPRVGRAGRVGSRPGAGAAARNRRRHRRRNRRARAAPGRRLTDGRKVGVTRSLGGGRRRVSSDLGEERGHAARGRARRSHPRQRARAGGTAAVRVPVSHPIPRGHPGAEALSRTHVDASESAPHAPVPAPSHRSSAPVGALASRRRRRCVSRRRWTRVEQCACQHRTGAAQTRRDHGRGCRAAALEHRLLARTPAARPWCRGPPSTTWSSAHSAYRPGPPGGSTLRTPRPRLRCSQPPRRRPRPLLAGLAHHRDGGAGMYPPSRARTHGRRGHHRRPRSVGVRRSRPPPGDGLASRSPPIDGRRWSGGTSRLRLPPCRIRGHGASLPRCATLA